jgi:bifunctional polynucleotide phosphatase/kinase
MNWESNSNYLQGVYKDATTTNKSKIAAFDFDDTIVRAIGKKFSVTDKDWEFFTDEVTTKLIDFNKQGYQIVIVSNQKGISNNKPPKEVWMKKLDNVAKQLNIPLIVLAATKNDLYRKPRTKLWNKFIKCDHAKSFYCGDAGGLPKRNIDGTQYRDFSDTDLKFALNLKIPFMHRDELIFGKDYSKKTYMIEYPLDSVKKGKYTEFKPKNKEIIINVGYSGSGKSYYTTKYVTPHNYVYVNQDTLKTKNKCIKACLNALKEGSCIVIDNTNPTAAVRKEYLDMAKKFNYNMKCHYFNTELDLSVHNNSFRHCVSDGASSMVPQIAYNIYKSKFEKPSTKEGFNEVDEIDFVLDKKGDIVDEYYQYYN